MKIVRTLEQRFWEKVDKNGPIPIHCPELGRCWVWIGSTVKGYGWITVRRRPRPLKSYQAHRLSYIWFMGRDPKPETPLVLHKCDNRACVRPDHLFEGSYADNSLDCCSKNRTNKNKLTAEQVLEIRTIGNTMMQKDIAKKFGVAKALISLILSRRIWKHI